MRAVDPESLFEIESTAPGRDEPAVRLVPGPRGRRRPTARGRKAAASAATAVAEPSPLVMLEAVASTAMVATAVACFVAVASTASAPLLAAGLMLGRLARDPGEA